MLLISTFVKSALVKSAKFKLDTKSLLPVNSAFVKSALVKSTKIESFVIISFRQIYSKAVALFISALSIMS